METYMRLIYIVLILLSITSCDEGTSYSDNSIIGQAGSRARFSISGDSLYTLNDSEMLIFDISVASEPLPMSKVSLPLGVETLFAFDNYLYIGAENGVYIYTKPTLTQTFMHIGTFTHAQSCDPVVVQDNLAFLTTRTGNRCRLQNGENSLQILDVSVPEQPRLTSNDQGFENARPMIEPSGLGIDGDKLFVCDGLGGLKLFNVEKIDETEGFPAMVNLTFDRNSSINDLDCFDVIPDNNTLIVSNGDDVRQFDYSTLPMAELGRIK